MDWWAGMNSCVASATSIGEMNQIEAIIFDPWSNCDELDLGSLQQHQHQQHQQQHQHQTHQTPALNGTAAVNSAGGSALATVIGSTGAAGSAPDCSCSPPADANHVLVQAKLEPVTHSVSSSLSSSSSSSTTSSSMAAESLAAVICQGGSESNNSSEYSATFGVGELQAAPSPRQTGGLSILCQQQQQYHQTQQQQQSNQPPQAQSRSRSQLQAQQQSQTQPQKVRRCRHITDYVLAEEEKRLLIKEGYTDFPMTCQARPLSKTEERILRKIRRKIRNKKSAQCSRQRKKEYVEDLERKYANVLKENEQLKDLLDQIQQHQLTNHLAVQAEESNHQAVRSHHQPNNHNHSGHLHNQHQHNQHPQQQQQQHNQAQHLDMNSDWRRVFDNNSNKLQSTTATDGRLDFL